MIVDVTLECGNKITAAVASNSACNFNEVQTVSTNYTTRHWTLWNDISFGIDADRNPAIFHTSTNPDNPYADKIEFDPNHYTGSTGGESTSIEIVENKEEVCNSDGMCVEIDVNTGEISCKFSYGDEYRVDWFNMYIFDEWTYGQNSGLPTGDPQVISYPESGFYSNDPIKITENVFDYLPSNPEGDELAIMCRINADDADDGVTISTSYFRTIRATQSGSGIELSFNDGCSEFK